MGDRVNGNTAVFGSATPPYHVKAAHAFAGDPSWLPTAHHSPAAYGRAAQALEKQADNIKVAIE
jgi:hypothetical protein